MAKHHYLRHYGAIASTDTKCDPMACTERGCSFPRCSTDFRSFKNEADADRYEKELKLLGHSIQREPF